MTDLRDQLREPLHAAISNAYYDARNSGRTMTDAADAATDAATDVVLAIVAADVPLDLAAAARSYLEDADPARYRPSPPRPVLLLGGAERVWEALTGMTGDAGRELAAKIVAQQEAGGFALPASDNAGGPGVGADPARLDAANAALTAESLPAEGPA